MSRIGSISKEAATLQWPSVCLETASRPSQSAARADLSRGRDVVSFADEAFFRFTSIVPATDKMSVYSQFYTELFVRIHTLAKYIAVSRQFD